MPFVVSIVAFSGSGKTTFLEKLIPALKQLGLRVGVLKHHVHATSFDVPGKDTYRLSAAGADMVVGAGPVQMAIFIPGDASTNLDVVIERYMLDLDIVLTEGYKRGHYPKVEIHRASRELREGDPDGLLCDPAELLAVVTDEHLALPDTIPQLDIDDVAGVARYLSGLVDLAGRR